MGVRVEKHIKIARAHRALSWLYALITGLMLALMWLPGGGKTPAALYLVAGMFAAMFALHHFTARGARAQHPAARIVSMVIGGLMLFAFPLGTIIGIYLLVNAAEPWSARAADTSIA